MGSNPPRRTIKPNSLYVLDSGTSLVSLPQPIADPTVQNTTRDRILQVHDDQAV